MKTIRWVLGLCLILVIAGSAANYFTPYPRIWIQTCGLNFGLIQVKDADWGFLKLRAGQAGLDALRDLEQYGATDKINVAAATVIRKYHGKGDKIPTFGDPIIIQEESRFQDLTPVYDAKNLKLDLLPGQTAPPDLMTDLRFDLDCGRKSRPCHMRLRDLDQDGKLEAILTSWVRIYVYAKQPTGWKRVASGNGCLEDEQALTNGSFSFEKPKFDDLIVNGHHAQIELSGCGSYRWPNEPDNIMRQLKPYAMPLAKSKVISPQNASVPKSLIASMVNGTLVSDKLSGDNLDWMPFEPGEKPTRVFPVYADGPGCADPKYGDGCLVVLADLDHDGTDEVIVINKALSEDTSDNWAMDIFRFDGAHWHIAGTGTICGEWGKDPARMTYGQAPSHWLSMHLNGKSGPSINEGGCTVRREVLS